MEKLGHGVGVWRISLWFRHLLWCLDTRVWTSPGPLPIYATKEKLGHGVAECRSITEYMKFFGRRLLFQGAEKLFSFCFFLGEVLVAWKLCFVLLLVWAWCNWGLERDYLKASCYHWLNKSDVLPQWFCQWDLTIGSLFQLLSY